MNNAMELIAECLPEVTVDDVRRRFRTVEIRDEKAFAAELQQYVFDTVSELALGLPDDLFSEGEPSRKPASRIAEFPPAARAAALRRELTRKADALVAAEPWQPGMTDLQRGRAILMEAFDAPSNMAVPDFAKLVGKVRQQVYADIKARRLLSISIGPKKQKVPEWQLDQTKLALTRSVLAAAPDVDNWTLYKALSEPLESLGGRAPVDVVEADSVDRLTKTVMNVLGMIPETTRS